MGGIHWSYNTLSHPTELTAGYYNHNGQEGHDKIAKMFAQYGAAFDFTCIEMKDFEQPEFASPEKLVGQVRHAVESNNLDFSSENALPRYDPAAYNVIVTQSYAWPQVSEFTYLRLTDELVYDYQLAHDFRDFVHRMNKWNRRS